MLNLRSIKIQLIIFLSASALFLSFKAGNLRFLGVLAITAILSGLLDSTASYFKTKKIKFPESGLVTGLIIGYVLASDNSLWVMAIACILAIGSKYLICWKQKHIFNPAAFGIFLATIIFSATTQWAGTYLWYILLPVGGYFIYKVRKIELFLGYAVVTLLLFGFKSLATNVAVYHVFGYLSYFYIFIMLIEPKTTPITSFGKIIFGVAAAVLIFFMTEKGARFDVELSALLIMNLFVPLANKIK